MPDPQREISAQELQLLLALRDSYMSNESRLLKFIGELQDRGVPYRRIIAILTFDPRMNSPSVTARDLLKTPFRPQGLTGWATPYQPGPPGQTTDEPYLWRPDESMKQQIELPELETRAIPKPCVLAVSRVSSENRFNREVYTIRLSTQDAMDVEQLGWASTNDLRNKLAAFKPVVVHLAGHNVRGGLEVAWGQESIHMRFEDLAQCFLGLHRPRLLVLSACKSNAYASHFLPHFDGVIGWPGDFDDAYAEAYAGVSYTAVTRGDLVSEATVKAHAHLSQKWRHVEEPKQHGLDLRLL